MAISTSYIDNSNERVNKQRLWLENDLASFRSELARKEEKRISSYSKKFSGVQLDEKIALMKQKDEKAIETRRNRYEAIIQKNDEHFQKKNEQLLRQKEKLARKLSIDKSVDPKEYAKKEAIIEAKIAKKAKAVEREDTRVFEIDLVRGIIIWGMIFDHFIGNFWYLYPNIFDYYGAGSNADWLKTMYSFSSSYWSNDIRCSFRFVGLMLLLVLTGISCHFSRSNWKRGLLVFSFGVIITSALNLFSCVAGQSEWCFFGTLTCIGSCIMLYTFTRWICKSLYNLYEKRLFYKKQYEKVELDDNRKLVLTENPKIWKWIALGLFIGLFGLSAYLAFSSEAAGNFDLTKDWWRILNGDGTGGRTQWISFDDLSAINSNNWYLIVFGRMGYGSDWLGLLPYLSYIFLGGFIGETLYKSRKSFLRFFYPNYDRSIPDYLFSRSGRLNADLNKAFYPVSYLGKKTIWVYIFHQPVYIIIMSIIILASGVSFSIF